MLHINRRERDPNTKLEIFSLCVYYGEQRRRFREWQLHLHRRATEASQAHYANLQSFTQLRLETHSRKYEWFSHKTCWISDHLRRWRELASDDMDWLLYSYVFLCG